MGAFGSTAYSSVMLDTMFMNSAGLLAFVVAFIVAWNFIPDKWLALDGDDYLESCPHCGAVNPHLKLNMPVAAHHTSGFKLRVTPEKFMSPCLECGKMYEHSLFALQLATDTHAAVGSHE